MRTFNTITIVGRLGKDPEHKTAANGTTVCSLNVATSRSYKQGDDWKEEVHWHRIVCFGQSADRAKDYRKGDVLIIQGDVRYRKWTDNNQQERTMTEINANSISLGEKYKGAQPSQTQAPGSQAAPAGAVGEATDDLPF